MRGLAFCLPILAFACDTAHLTVPAAPAETRNGRWIQDILYVCDNVERIHPDPFRRASQLDFNASRDRLVEDVPELSDGAIIVRLAAIVALLHDAHTTVGLPIGGPRLPALPLEVIWIDGAYRVVALPQEHAELLEGRLVRIGGVDVGRAIERLGTVVSIENEVGLHTQTMLPLRSPTVLQVLGLATTVDSARYAIETSAGVQSIEIALPDDSEEPALAMIRRDSVPFTDERTDELYWYREIPDHRALYVAYNACREDPGRSFKGFAREVLERLASPEIERLILDFRRNEGGGQLVARPLLDELHGHRLDRPGGILVLIGSRTFSSAKGNALDLLESTDAILVGSPTRQRVNSFGAIKAFKSPNFGLSVGCSTHYFARGSEEEVALRPRIEVRPSLDDWKNGLDRVLFVALRYKPRSVPKRDKGR